MTKPKNELGEQKMALIPVAEYKELLELCLRAANALEGWCGDDEWTSKEDIALIAELRKAAG